MIAITITDRDGAISRVECSGHSGYSRSGTDIVCAAVSAVVQTALLGLQKVVEVDVDYVRNEKTGYLLFDVPTLAGQQAIAADAIMDTMLAGLQDLCEGYPKYIKLEVKNDVH